MSLRTSWLALKYGPAILDDAGRLLIFADKHEQNKSTMHECVWLMMMLSRLVVIYNLYFAPRQVPSAPPTYTGRQLWWARGSSARTVENEGKKRKKRMRREGSETKGPLLGCTGLKTWTPTWSFSLCVQTQSLTVCQSTIVWVCVRPRDGRAWRTELKLF